MKYCDLLSQCWEKHLKNDGKGPTVISLFAGCGGSSLGYSMAGYHELLAVEWDKNAADTFRLNFPSIPVFNDDIAKLSIDECLRMTGLKSGELDVLDGSPPCQGFSTVGKRDFKDDRNNLYKEYLRLLRGLQPKVFVMENVSGMVKGTMKNRWLEIMADLKESGYNVKCKLMNAANYSVPQSRQRVVFIGIRNDINIDFIYPIAKNKVYSAKEAIPELLATRSQRINPFIDSDKPCTTICKTLSGYDCIFNNDSELDESKIKETWQSFRVLSGKEKKKHFSLVKLQLNKPSCTITKDAGNTSTGLIHPYIIRKLTISEIKRLQSFPDEFCIIGNYHQKWSQVGNSVPPLMMMAIAENIKTQMVVT